MVQDETGEVERKAGRQVARLRAIDIDRLPPGLYADGAGLYLVVKPSGARSWIYRYSIGRKMRDMGLGALHTVPLALARKKALEARQARLDGIDPIERRRTAKAQAVAELARGTTFDQAAKEYIAAQGDSWRNEKHAAQWQSTLDAYAKPLIGNLACAAIDAAAVLKVLQPIWSTKPETATRLRGRIEAILDYARVKGYCAGDNPARWRGHLDQTLPRRAKVAPVRHFSAMKYTELPAFMPRLAASLAVAHEALQFAILTCARTGEVLGGTWSEIDLAGKVWIIHGTRMKVGKEHRVPLSVPALAILERMKQLRRTADSPLFPGQNPGRPLSNMAMLAVLKRLGRGDLTTHGFRSTFRDWAAETTDYPAEILEMALAHTVADKVEAAYRRGDMFAKRVALMGHWGAFCTGQPWGDIAAKDAKPRERRSRMVKA